MWFKSLLFFAAFICLTQAKKGDVPKGFGDNSTAVDVRSVDEIYDATAYPFMGSLQRASRGGYSCKGFSAVFVAASWALAFPDAIAQLMDGPHNVKKIVIITNTVDPASEGKIHRVKKIVSNSSPFRVLKTSDEVHPWIKIASKAYVLNPTDVGTYLYWARYQDSLYEENAVSYDPSLCGGLSGPNYCTASLDSDYMNTGSPMINSDKDLVGILNGRTAGVSEAFYFVPFFRDEILEAIKAN